MQSGYDISVAADSQTGFASNFNLLYTSGSGQVGLWQQIARPTLATWRNADFTDADSLSLNPEFVNVAGGDFHEQSLQGSFHGGCSGPGGERTHGAAGLPQATLTADANESPAIDMGSASDSYANEPLPNGGYINIGAYGDTTQASISPVQYLLVTHPGAGGEVWPEGQTFNITWRFALAPVNGSTPPAGTVDINLLQVGSSTPVLNIASGVANNGQYSWTLPNLITPGSNYLVQVSSDQYAGLSATSAQPFTIPAAVHTYYINDGTLNPGDWTTAPETTATTGLRPPRPRRRSPGCWPHIISIRRRDHGRRRHV